MPFVETIQWPEEPPIGAVVYPLNGNTAWIHERSGAWVSSKGEVSEWVDLLQDQLVLHRWVPAKVGDRIWRGVDMISMPIASTIQDENYGHIWTKISDDSWVCTVGGSAGDVRRDMLMTSAYEVIWISSERKE